MLWGAFNNASTAMSAMSWDMGTISQNVSNMNTVGYKRKDTQFKTMLSEGLATPAGTNIFGVKTADRTIVTKQGNAMAGSNWSDVAINGRGFFIVSRPDATGNPLGTVSLTDSQNVLYTRAGTFQETTIGTPGTSTVVNSGNPTQSPGASQQRYLTTASGEFLMGWQADAYGRIAGIQTTYSSPVPPGGTAAGATTGATATGGTTLVPISVMPNLLLDGVATSSIKPVINIPSNADMTPLVFTNSTQATDPLGGTHQLDLTWTRSATAPDTWTVSYNVNDGQGTVATPTTVTFDSQGNITAPSNSLGTVGYDEPTIDWAPLFGGVSTPTTVAAPGISLNGMKPSLETVDTTLTVYDAEFNPHMVVATFEHAANDAWNMSLLPQTRTVDAVDATGAAITGGAQITGVISAVTYTSNGVTTTSAPGSVPIQFDGGGNIISPQNMSFTVTWTVSPVGAMTPATAHTASTLIAPGENVVDMDLSKLSQFSDATKKVLVKNIDQDGYEKGQLDNLQIIGTGEVVGHFTNGHARTLYVIPVATFVAPNALESISGTMFRYNMNAGAISVEEIAKQGSGAQIVGGMLEGSNVDLEDEFTRMIITQKAYSSNAQVFKTADEMTTVARDLHT